MALPTTRTQFKDHCLRRLGYPVVKINVDDEQLEDRIDEALSYYKDYHYDGTEVSYLAHQITETDVSNKYIALDSKYEYVTGLFELFAQESSSALFNVRYQMARTDFFNLASRSIVPFFLSMTHLELIRDFLGENPRIRFNRHTDRLHIDWDWSLDRAGGYIIIEGYKKIDPEEFNDVWTDKWLIKYATALFKRQWGSHLIKFNLILPGNTTVNGQDLYTQAVDEINKLEDEMISSYSLPPMDMIG